MDFLEPYQVYILSFTSAIVLSLVFVPQIIKVSGRKMLFDMPDNERKFHTNIVPQLGGTGIFFAYIIPACLLLQQGNLNNWNNIIAAFLMLFITGLIDDLRSLNATRKFAAQFLPAIITVYLADVRLSSLYGFLGIEELSYWVSITVSIVGCIFVTNAFNFIDGVDGLAASFGIIMCFTLGLLLAAVHNVIGAGIAFSLMGALVGFLRFNFPPARIFMGDTGSLPIGFTISALSIILVKSSNQATPIDNIAFSEKSALAIVIGILFIITADSIRVFITRLIKGVSPFRGDRNHIHHYLLDAGLSQSQTVAVLSVSQLIITIIMYLLRDYNLNIATVIVLILCTVAFFIVLKIKKRRSITR